MNAFLANLREIAGLLLAHPWGSAPATVALCVTALVLFFGAGTIARVIFGKDTGLLRTFLVALLVIAAGLAGAAATWTWLTARLDLAAGAGALIALAAVWPASRVLRVPFGQAFGIMLFTVGITAGVAYGAGRFCGAIMESARHIETSPNVRKAE